MKIFSSLQLSMQWVVPFIFSMVLLSTLLVLLTTHKTSFGGWQAFIVRSGSMAPRIPTGSVVIAHQAQEYHAQEVVTFRAPFQPTKFITHRVIEKRAEQGSPTYIVKGDANTSADPHVLSSDDILGKTVLTIPYLGYFLGFLQTPAGVVLGIVMPGTILVYEQLRSLKKNWSAHKVQTLATTVALLVFFLSLPVASTWAAYANQADIKDMVLTTTQWETPATSEAPRE